MEAVVGRAHHDAPQRPERPAEVGVGQGHQARIHDERGARDGPTRTEDEDRQQCREIGRVHEGVGAKGGEHTHVLLGVVEGMEPPQRQGAMVGHVRSPVHGIDPDEDGGDHYQLRHHRQVAEEQEAGVRLDLHAQPGLHQGEQRQDHHGEDAEIGGVDQVGPSHERPWHGGPQALGNEHDRHEDDKDRTGRMVPRRRQRAREVPGGHEGLQADVAEPHCRRSQPQYGQPRPHPGCRAQSGLRRRGRSGRTGDSQLADGHGLVSPQIAGPPELWCCSVHTSITPSHRVRFWPAFT